MEELLFWTGRIEDWEWEGDKLFVKESVYRG